MHMVMDSSETDALFDKWQPQARKGWLECFLLLVLSHERGYGYQVATQLREALNAELPEGTLYPLLRRMQRDGLVDTEWDTESGSNPRKYYTITPRGRLMLEKMRTEFEHWQKAMDTLEGKP